ncbi:MAG: hypothetical protein AABY32_04040 [Nanoarchaeota archaeon]
MSDSLTKNVLRCKKCSFVYEDEKSFNKHLNPILKVGDIVRSNIDDYPYIVTEIDKCKISVKCLRYNEIHRSWSNCYDKAKKNDIKRFIKNLSSNIEKNEDEVKYWKENINLLKGV